MNALFLISWFAFSYSFPFTVNFGVQHAVASKSSEVERIINGSGVYMPKVSVIQNGRLKSWKLLYRVEE